MLCARLRLFLPCLINVILFNLDAASAFVFSPNMLNRPPSSTPELEPFPEWENRPGPFLSQDEFMKSDSSKPDASDLWECPLTRWDYKYIDLAEARAVASKLPGCPAVVRATADDNNQGISYFATNKEKLRQLMQDHGAVWLRGFEITKTVTGYREMYDAMGFVPCLDPLHSSGLRKFASERDGVYEEVNKPSLRGHYIGLHAESTTKRTPPYAAFVCFQRATEKGGRFFIADGAKILADMDYNILNTLYQRQVRISVSNLDVPPALPPLIKSGFKSLVEAAVAPKFDMDLEMVYEADGKPGRLQAIELAESPINRHPITNIPVWLCNAHNHLRALRDGRPCTVPEVGMTDVYFGDLTSLGPAIAAEIKRCSENAMKALPMEAGDVLLVDNYRSLHGRDVFEGERYHAVSWFTWDGDGGEGTESASAWRGSDRRLRNKDGLNKVINEYLDWLPKDFK